MTQWKRCETCTHWVPSGDSGECHHGSPGIPSATYSGRWPQVGPDESCGDHSFNPEPLLAELENLNRRVEELEFQQLQYEQLQALYEKTDQPERMSLPVITGE